MFNVYRFFAANAGIFFELFLPLVTADVGKIFDLHLFLRKCIAELLHHPKPTPACLEDPLNPLVRDYH